MKVQWFSGPPPAVGWWPAAELKTDGYYRWWNGSYWSYIAIGSDTKAVASKIAEMKDHKQASVLWRHWSIEIDGTDGQGAHL